jgi:hypothetical protein
MIRLCITHRGGLLDHSQANCFLNEHDFPRTIHFSLQRRYLIFGTNESRGSKIPNVLMLMCSFFCYMHVFAHCKSLKCKLAVESVSTKRCIANSIPRKCKTGCQLHIIHYSTSSSLGLAQHKGKVHPLPILVR